MCQSVTLCYFTQTFFWERLQYILGPEAKRSIQVTLPQRWKWTFVCNITNRNRWAQKTRHTAKCFSIPSIHNHYFLGALYSTEKEGSLCNKITAGSELRQHLKEGRFYIFVHRVEKDKEEDTALSEFLFWKY